MCHRIPSSIAIVLADQDTVDQFDWLAFRKDAKLNHAMELGDTQTRDLRSTCHPDPLQRCRIYFHVAAL